MATPSASEILDWNNLSLGTASKSDVRRVFRLADDGGTLQAGDMLLVSDDPCDHTACSLRRALCIIGCEPQVDEDS